MIIDEVLSGPDFEERHSIRVAATPAATLAAARATTVREVPIFVVLMALRGLPRLLSRRNRLELDAPILTVFDSMGFAVAGASGSELVVVGVGRFWRLEGGLRPIAAGDFGAFAEPGYAKTAFNFSVEPDGDGTRLMTETRVLATDPEARRSFGRYWRLIRPGSAAIRRNWLRAIRKRAERGGADSGGGHPR